MKKNIDVVNLYFDRSESKNAILAAGIFSAAGIGSWLLIQLAVKHTTGSERPITMDAAAVFLVVPISLFGDTTFKRRYLFLFLAILASFAANVFLGMMPLGLLAHWLIFALCFFFAERADYAAKSKPVAPTNRPPGQI
ncbi:MAG: hypothetical protein QE269_11625 [Fimbriimonas sp.]|nr:hypothetical protein [Fimbriimonas sp.]